MDSFFTESRETSENEHQVLVLANDDAKMKANVTATNDSKSIGSMMGTVKRKLYTEKISMDVFSFSVQKLGHDVDLHSDRIRKLEKRMDSFEAFLDGFVKEKQL